MQSSLTGGLMCSPAGKLPTDWHSFIITSPIADRCLLARARGCFVAEILRRLRCDFGRESRLSTRWRLFFRLELLVIAKKPCHGCAGRMGRMHASQPLSRWEQAGSLRMSMIAWFQPFAIGHRLASQPV